MPFLNHAVAYICDKIQGMYCSAHRR